MCVQEADFLGATKVGIHDPLLRRTRYFVRTAQLPNPTDGGRNVCTSYISVCWKIMTWTHICRIPSSGFGILALIIGTGHICSSWLTSPWYENYTMTLYRSAVEIERKYSREWFVGIISVDPSRQCKSGDHCRQIMGSSLGSGASAPYVHYNSKPHHSRDDT